MKRPSFGSQKTCCGVCWQTELEILHNFKMTIVTDNIQVKNGVDFSFVCSKIPFAISCSSTLHHGEYNYIDLDLVTKYLLCTYKNEKMILAKIF